MLTAHPVPGKGKSRRLCEAFRAGAPRDAVGTVWYGVTDANVQAFRRAQASGEPWWYIDNSYFDCARGRQYRVTRNRLQHTGQGETDGKRLAALGVQVKPERGGGRYVLAIEQSPVFMCCSVAASGWLLAASLAAQVQWGLPIRMRAWQAGKPGMAAEFERELADAAVVVAHSSAAAVEAVCAGVPVIVSKTSAAYSLGGCLPSVDERLRWASVLADNQWTIGELEDGTAWRALSGQSLVRG